MKIKKLLVSAVSMLFICSANVFAADTVRVGLEKNFKGVSSITAINNDILVTANGKTYDEKINGGYTMSHISKSYYKLNASYSSYTETVTKTPAYTGYSCIPVLTDNGWTLYFTTNKKPSANVTQVTTGKNAILFANNGVNKFIVDSSTPVQISSASGILDLQKGKYRDKLEFYVTGNSITGVNVIDREHYLYGVINSEMPASWPLEAQKAQAVAARTYISATTNKHTGYDLCDNTNCQEYNGTANETEAGRKAVDETAGVEIFYDNKPINAVYFSSDGGATYNSEDVWSATIPYLRGVVDNNEKEYKEWTRTFTYGEITNMCNAKGFNIGTVSKVSAEYNANGLCIGLTFHGSSGVKTVTKEEIRTVFSGTSGGSLLSRNFVLGDGGISNVPVVHTVSKDGTGSIALNQIVAKNSVNQDSKIQNFAHLYSKNGDKSSIAVQQSSPSTSEVKIVGKGYGHGVGMSQYGAKALAENGYTYQDILKYYYTNVEIK